MYRIGIDIGSTFTDAYVVRDDGSAQAAKVSSNHSNLESTFTEAIEACAELEGVSVEQLMSNCDLVVNATTVATNAIVTRNGARIGLLTTTGFRDVIFIGRIVQKVAGVGQDDLRDFFKLTKADPIVSKSRVAEIDERVDFKGDVLCPLDPGQVRRAAGVLLDQDVEAIAVCLAFAYKNPAHEHAVRDIVRELAPHIPVSISSDISLRVGEYERTATTAVTSYVTPKVKDYLDGINRGLKGHGYQHDPLIMQSFGGIGLPEVVEKRAVSCIASGPVAGVIGARALGDTLGYHNLLCTDIGGASFDVGMIWKGEPKLQHEPVISKYSLQLSVVDVVSIGAGGGSIAWIDDTGGLKVGPQSAQSVPGPACFGRGGEQPTLTDADLLLGYLNADYFAGGSIGLDKAKAEAAVGRLAAELDRDVIEVASGIFDIMNAQCADLIRMYTVKSGFDPRDFAVLAYGGAGPTHAAWYARELGPKKIIISPHSGVFSASGLLSSDVLGMYELSDPMSCPVDPERSRANFAQLDERANAEFAQAGVKPEDRIIRRSVSMSFSDQARGLSVPVMSTDDTTIKSLEERFKEIYAATYGSGAVHEGAPVEVSSYRVEMVARMDRPQLPRFEPGSTDPTSARKGFRDAWFNGGFVNTPVYDMRALKSGMAVEGPAIVEDRLTTCVIDSGQVGQVDPWLNIQIEA